MSNKRRKNHSAGNRETGPDNRTPRPEESKALQPENETEDVVEEEIEGIEEITEMEWDMEAILQEEEGSDWEELGDEETDPEDTQQGVDAAYEDEDGEDDDDGFAWEQSYVEREEPMPPSRGLMILTVLLLFVVVVLLCVILWRVTHAQQNSSIPGVGTTQEYQVEETFEEETEPESSVAAETESSPEPQPETDASPEPTPYVEEGQVYTEPISGDSTMSFTEVEETVTAKDVTNLRSVPDTSDSDNVIQQLLNGETLTRTGINADTGWSRLTYDGQTVYAVSQYLTTDLNYKPPVAATDPNRITTQDGRVIIFEDWDDYITPKEYVNLRVEPSTSQGRSTVNAQVNLGMVLHRTGRSADSGWSRVEYNGRTLYVVSSYMTVTDATAASTPTPVATPTPVTVSGGDATAQ